MTPTTIKRIKAIEQRNRARARAMGADFEPVDFHAVCERDNWRCAICGEPIDPDAPVTAPLRDSVALSLEHFPALASGGSHTFDGIAPAHLSCNLRKGAADTARAAKTKRQAGEKGQQARRERAKASGKRRLQSQKLRSGGFKKAEPQRSATRPVEKRT
jgi:hypothetical protein